MVSAWSEASFFLELDSHLGALEGVVKNALADASARAARASEKVPEMSPGALDGDAPEFAVFESHLDEHRVQQQRLRLLRMGLFLAAYAQFEHIAIETAEAAGPGKKEGLVNRIMRRVRRRSERHRLTTATRALRRLRPQLREAFYDSNDLQRRVQQLETLRNELAHRGGYAPVRTVKALQSLIQSEEVSIGDDIDDSVVEFAEGFLHSALEDLYRASLGILRAAGILSCLPVHGFLGHLIGAACPCRGGVHDGDPSLSLADRESTGA